MLARQKSSRWHFSRHCLLALLLFAGSKNANWAATLSVLPDADSFVRSFAPASNYGAGGALAVSGTAAVNGFGVQNGLFDSLMRFQMSNVVASLDDALVGHDWVLTGARLVVTEMAAPDNAIFNRGVGAFEVRWQAADNWLEGTGTPKAPTTDGLTWDDLGSLVNSNLDISLGVFTNAGVNGQSAFALELPERFVADVRAGDEVTLHLTAASAEVGFTFNSRDFGNTNAQPRLEVTAVQNPKPMIDRIESVDGNVVIAFIATTNWTYQLERACFLPGAWTNVLTIAGQNSPTNVVFMDGRTNAQAFYRLSVSQ